jgi:PIN domain nuclease of toxin-antitoxin system
MKELLDTHTFLWYVKGDLQLSSAAKELLEDNLTDKYISLASIWELAIKISLNKLKLTKKLGVFISEYIHVNNFYLLDIKIEHIDLLSDLPFHHKDPFDRLLISQSIIENLPIISKDSLFDFYNVKRYW